MKKGFITLSIAAALVMAQARPAQAINEAWSAVAGFAGGLLVANAAHNHHNHHVVHQQRVVYNAPVQTRVVHTGPAVNTVVYRTPVPAGYYTWRTSRVHVPGRWVYENTGCNIQRRVWHPAHVTVQRQRVWIAGIN